MKLWAILQGIIQYIVALLQDLDTISDLMDDEDW